MDILVYPATRRIFDLDNLGKSLLDALTKAGVWTDDAQIDSLHFERGPVIKGGTVTVFIRDDAPGAVPLESPAVGREAEAKPGFITAEQYRAQAKRGRR